MGEGDKKTTRWRQVDVGVILNRENLKKVLLGDPVELALKVSDGCLIMANVATDVPPAELIGLLPEIVHDLGGKGAGA